MHSLTYQQADVQCLSLCDNVQHIVGDVPEADVRECSTRTRRTWHQNVASTESNCPQRGTKTAGELGGEPVWTQEVGYVALSPTLFVFHTLLFWFHHRIFFPNFPCLVFSDCCSSMPSNLLDPIHPHPKDPILCKQCELFYLRRLQITLLTYYTYMYAAC